MSILLYTTFNPKRNASGNLGNDMKMKSQLNETTRIYPRTMQDAFPNTVSAIEQRQRWEWLEGHVDSFANQAEFWVYIACAFAAGFVTHTIWG